MAEEPLAVHERNEPAATHRADAMRVCSTPPEDADQGRKATQIQLFLSFTG